MSTPSVAPATHSILAFYHCGLCLDEVRAIIARTGLSQSPATYQRLEVGMTKFGVQVWCRRHGANVVHIDFLGHNLPQNTARAAS